MARISGNEKLFRLDVDTGRKTQLTFGTHDDGAGAVPRRGHARLLVDRHRSVAADRSGRRAQRQHLQHLDAEPEDRRAAAVHRRHRRQPLRRRAAARARARRRSAFISYYKGDYELHTLERRDPIVTAASSDFGAPGPSIIDFQAPLSHTLVADKNKKKGTFEKMFLDGRPPVNVGVTSGGDIFGGSAVTFSDVLGDQQFNLYAASISQYRTLSFSYLNLARRFNYALQGYSQTQFFYGQLESVFYDPSFSGYHRSRLRRSPRARCAAAPRSASGRSTATAASRCSAGCCSTTRSSTIRACRTYSERLPAGAVRPAAVPHRHLRPARRQLRPGDDGLPRVRTAGRQHHAPAPTRSRRRSATRCRARPPTSTRATTSASARSGLLALRARGFKSWGDAPDFMYFGGNSEMRGYEYLRVRRRASRRSSTPSCASRSSRRC